MRNKLVNAAFAMLLGVAAGVGLAACSGSSSSGGQNNAGAIPVIIDTDVDSDDAMAILYLLSDPKVNVLGISVSGTGFMPLEKGVPIAQRIAALAGKPSLPVAYGTYLPINPLEGFPESWRQGAEKFYDNAGLPPVAAPPSSRMADRLIVELVKNSPEPVTILGLAPNTNIAMALNEEPSIASNIKQVVLSAGSFGQAGNVFPLAPEANTQLEQTPEYKALANAVNKHNTAEYNVALDAPATSDVIQSGVPVYFSPLNASQKAPVSREFLTQLQSGSQNPVVKFVVGDLSPLLSQPGQTTFMWDPVAAAQISNPGLCTRFQDGGAVVSLTGDRSYGTTSMNPSGNKVRICTDLDASGFFQDFLKVVQNAPAASASASPTAG